MNILTLIRNIAEGSITLSRSRKDNEAGHN